MEKVKNRYDIVMQTLKTLKEVLDLLEKKNIPNQYYLSLCDSAIQRFEYSIDTFWKFLKIYLSDALNVTIEVSSPRAIIREAVNAGILTKNEFERLINGVICRNETSHAYNRELANEILSKIPKFYETMHEVMNRIVI